MVVRAFATSRCGWTLIELLTAVGVLGVLMALLVPAVMQVRESARRTQCQSNLRQIGIAIASYESTFRMFPPGGEVNGWLPRLLPFMGQGPLFEMWENGRTDHYHPV